MLTQIDVNSENAFYVPILGVTPKDSLLVRKITGLTPPDPSLFIGDYARDGGIYQGRRVGNRNVVITFDLNPNPALGETTAGLREMLYKAFLDPTVDADYIKLTLHEDDGRVRYLVGYTEKFEGELFDSDTSTQISIVCPDPYIRDNAETVLKDPSGWSTVPFTYTGTAETGFAAEIYIVTTTGTLTLENNLKTMVITSALLTNGKMVYVNTVRGSRQLLIATVPSAWASGSTYTQNDVVSYGGQYYVATSLTGNTNKQPDLNPTYWTLADLTTRWAALQTKGLTTSLLGALASTSPWLELHSQSNTMKVYGATTASTPAAIRELRYTQSYWGL